MKTWLSGILLLLLSQTGLAANHAVILQYHHFGSDTPASTSVTMALFQRHVDYLSNNHFSIRPLDQVVEHLKNSRPLPERCAAITIDDAYVSVYEKAFPILKEHGWPFTVFVATRPVDIGSKSMLSWDQMREMAAHKAGFASHTTTHPYLLDKAAGESESEWKARIIKEIKTSMDRIKTEIGRCSPLFAYPYGEYNTTVKKIVTDMGLAGFGQQSGPAWTGSDFGVLPRFPMSAGYAQMEGFVLKVNSLPLPVVRAFPDNPVIPAGSPAPVLRVSIADGDYKKETLSCFLSGHGAIPLKWLDRKNNVVEAGSDLPLQRGRSRYNFTALHKDGSRYFWYSHLWIHGKTPE